MMERKTTGSAPGGRRGWYARRGITVADDLDQLRGPTATSLTLPPAIEASHRTPYDVADPYDRSEAHCAVLMQAATQDDLSTWLDRDELVRLWCDLHVPVEIRAAWQARHPALADAGASADVQQR